MFFARNRRLSFVTVSIAIAFLLYLFYTSNHSASTQATGATSYFNQLLSGGDNNNNDDVNDGSSSSNLGSNPPITIPSVNETYFWAQLKQRYPVQATIPVPSPVPKSIPPIQYRFPKEASSTRSIRQARLDAVKGNFSHSWSGYKKYAWMSDEVKPISGQAHDPFGGWAATLVDTLGMHCP